MSSMHESGSEVQASTERGGYAETERGGYAGYETETYRETGMTGSAAAAGWLLVLGGLWGFFLGLALVLKASYFRSLTSYTSASGYVYHWNLSGWGWTELILGVVTLAAGASVLLGQEWARWAGIVLAVFSGIATFMFLPFFPFWAIVILAIDVFIVWALTARWQPAGV